MRTKQFQRCEVLQPTRGASKVHGAAFHQDEHLLEIAGTWASFLNPNGLQPKSVLATSSNALASSTPVAFLLLVAMALLLLTMASNLLMLLVAMPLLLLASC